MQEIARNKPNQTKPQIISCLALLALAYTPTVQAEQARDMIVMLKSSAVDKQFVAPNVRIDNVFLDQRVAANSEAWASVSLKTAALVHDLESSHQLKARGVFGALTHGFGASLTDTQISRLKSDPRIESVFSDAVGRPAGTPSLWSNNPVVPTQNWTFGWNLYAIGANANPNYRTQENYPIKAYVIDAGIQPHTDLKFDWQTDHISFDMHGNTPQYSPVCDSHGTHVAGIIGANWTASPWGVEGVAPGISLKSVRVINYCKPFGTGLTYLSDVLSAINWVSSQVGPYNSAVTRRLGAIANMSIVWDGVNPASSLYINPAAQTALRDTIARATQNGVFFSFAAGNSNEPACNIYPAALAKNINGAMAVGAIADTGLAMSYGETIATYGPCVEIWAPGQSVQSTGADPMTGNGNPAPDAWGYIAGTNNYYQAMTGSSMAAPHVAGAAALVARLYQQNGRALPYPAEIEAMLKNPLKTRQLGSYGPPPYTGTINLLRIDNITLN